MTEVRIKAEMNLSVYEMYDCNVVKKYVIPKKGYSNKEVERKLAQMIADNNCPTDIEGMEFHALEVPDDDTNSGYRIFWVWVE